MKEEISIEDLERIIAEKAISAKFPWEPKRIIIETIIRGEVYEEFNSNLKQLFNSLSEKEIALNLHALITQLETHHPEIRRHQFFKKYFPEGNFRAEHLWEYYSDNFNLFRNLIIDYQRLNNMGHIGNTIQKNKLQTEKRKTTFETFVNQESQQYILHLLENLQITKEGISQLTERRKGALRGVVEALRDANLIPNYPLDVLCQIIAKKIRLTIKSKLDYSSTSNKYMADTAAYLLSHPLQQSQP